MKFRCQSRALLCLPVIVFLITLLWDLTCIAATRRNQNKDSILEIMNAHEIGKLLQQRRQNYSSSEMRDSSSSSSSSSGSSGSSSLNDRRRYYLQNDLLDPLSQSDERSMEHYSKSPRQPGASKVLHSPASGDNNDRSQKFSMEDVFLPFNETLKVGSSSPADLHILHANKLLKSSKNALYITRKEYLKKDWCKTEPLIQRIREPGCLTRTFVNRFCYGQCNSFYIPKSPKRRRNFISTTARKGASPIQSMHFEDEDLTAAAFQSCGFCKPKKHTWITVTLRCPSLIPQLRRKRIQKIKQCKCMAEPVR